MKNYDCIASYHMNPLTCGIAKFNVVLANKMSVPCVDMFSSAIRDCSAPLLSLKLSEFSVADLGRLGDWMDARDAHGGFGVFLHGYDGTDLENEMCRRANAVYCGNSVLYESVRNVNPNSSALWCPGTNTGGQLFTPTDLSVFSFGMAHKLRTDKYHRLKKLLDGTGKSYSIYLSTALHEGTTFDDSFNDVFKEMQGIFGDQVYFLGYLSDQAVFNYLRASDYFAAFFSPGVRANNTSVNAALESGIVVITNLDEHSPSHFKHLENIIDVDQAAFLPHEDAERARLSANACELIEREFSWEKLIQSINVMRRY